MSASVQTYYGQNCGVRVGFRVIDRDTNVLVHDSGPIYNDEDHVTAAVNKFMDRRDKYGTPIRGNRISAKADGSYSKRALKAA